MKHMLVRYEFRDDGFFTTECIVGTDDAQAIQAAVERARNTSLTPGALAALTPGQFAQPPGRTGFPVRIIEVDPAADYAADQIFAGRILRNVKEAASELGSNYHVLARAMKEAAPNPIVMKGVTLQFERDYRAQQEQAADAERQIRETEAEIAAGTGETVEELRQRIAELSALAAAGQPTEG